MYSKIAEEEDSKMTERWQKDADGITIFVSPRVSIRTPVWINWSVVGQFILCCRRYVTLRHGTGLKAEFSVSGELGILSQEHLSVSLPAERVM
jgi:hypothetical protein